MVDLRDPRCARLGVKDRFIERVCSAEEAEVIRSSPSPATAVWVHWAAKEAAFKVVTKVVGSPPTFEHAAFRLRLDDCPGAGSDCESGSVTFRGLELPVRIEREPDRIHVVAWHPDPADEMVRLHRQIRHFPELSHPNRPEWMGGLRGRFTEREWRAIHGPASALVRLRARADLARALNITESVLEIASDDGPAGRMPPRVFVDGEPCSTDLSLSHHGRFLAWAFTLPSRSDL